MHSNIVLLIAGKIGSGKNYLTKYLTEILTRDIENQIYVRHLAFANNLKVMCALGAYASESRTIDDAYEQYYNIKDDPERIELQEVGQEMRELDSDVWVKMIANDIKNDIMYDVNIPSVYILSDFRYPNEADYLINLSLAGDLDAIVYTIHITRDFVENIFDIMSHVTENVVVDTEVSENVVVDKGFVIDSETGGEIIINTTEDSDKIKNHSSENALEDYDFFVEFDNSGDNSGDNFEMSFNQMIDRIFFAWLLFYKYDNDDMYNNEEIELSQEIIDSLM